MKIPFLSIAIILIVAASASAQDVQHFKHAENTLPGVEPEMMRPEYWINLMDDPDGIVMNADEIDTFNKQLRSKKVSFPERFGKPDPLEKDFGTTLLKGLIMNPLKPLDLPATISGDSLKSWIGYNVNFLNSRDFYDNRNVTYTAEMKRELIEKMNIGAIPDSITRRYGLIVNHSNSRYFPTDFPGFSETKWELDFFQATGVLIGSPVTVLHQSKDGDFYFVETEIVRGWINAKNIAIGDRDYIRSITDSQSFLMSASDKIPVYADKEHSIFSRHLYFSATMPLIGSHKSGYVVIMPYRQQDGSLAVMNGFVRPDADIHVGYLPYTKRNVITQLFKLLNKPYGWGDQDNKRSCAGTMRVLIRCFGLKTGRHPSFLLSAPDTQTFIDPRLSTEEKLVEAAKIEPFVTMAGSPGHVVLYMGKGLNGKQYFMHQAGWGYDDGDTHYYVNRTTINDVEHVFYDISKPKVFATYR